MYFSSTHKYFGTDYEALNSVALGKHMTRNEVAGLFLKGLCYRDYI